MSEKTTIYLNQLDFNTTQNYTYTSNSIQWTVLPGVPALTGITPTSALAGQTVSFRATGSNLSAGAELLLDDALVQGIQYGLRNATELNATFPAPIARTYAAKIRVVEQSTTTLPFTVTNPQVTITTESTTPPQAVVNQSVQVAYGGSGFLANITSVSVIGPGGAVIVTPSISANTINFSFTPTLGGAYTVTIQNPGTTAVVKNVTVLTPPSAPTLGSLSTTVLDAGSPQQIITLTGTNFQPNSKVLVGSDSTTVTTVYISSTQLSATIPAAKFVQPNQTLNISVATPPFYGLTIGQSSSLALYVIYPQPTLTSISPNALAARSIPFGTEQPLTFTGSGFYPGTQILWDYNTANLSTLPFSGTVNNNVGTATLNLGAAYFSTPRVVKVVISNPGYQPQNGPVFPARSTTSTPLDFTINTIKPILTSVSPRQIVWNGTPFDQIVTASGTNFFSSSRLIVVNDNERELAPVANQDGAGTLSITGLGTFLVKVKNPAVASGDTTRTSDYTDTITVVNPAPSVTSLTPSSFAVSVIPTSITLQGQAFMSGMTATIAGLPATVVPTSQTSVTLQLTPQIQQAISTLGAGTYNIVLTNPAPSLGAGGAQVTVVNPPMSSFTIAPSPFTLTVPTLPQTLTLSAGAGSAFASNATVSIGGNAIPNASITRTSPSQISVVVPVQWMTPAGTFTLTVTNLNVASGQSGTANTSWQVRNPQPIVSLVNTVPTPVVADGSPVNVIIFGSQFMPGASVTLRGLVVAQTSLTNSRIDATISAGMLDSAGTFPVVVTNTNSGGAAQTQPLLTVLAPRPRLTTLGQQTLTIGANAGQPLVLNMGGSGFVRGSRFVWNVLGAQSSITTTYTNSNNLTVTIPANLLNQAGVYRVAVVNDPFNGQGGGVSDTLTFTVNNPQASITTLQPSNLLPRFATSAPLTFIGSDFITGARLLVTGLNNVVDTLTTQVQSATQLTATLPASLLDSAATLTLRILNPTPTVNVSNGVSASVVNPRPRLTSLSQTSTLTGLPSLTLTASGSQFMDGAIGYANNVAMQTVVNNTGSLTLTVPASELAIAGTVRITVQNPLPRVQPDVSDTLLLKVDNPLPQLDSVNAAMVGSVITVSTQATTVQLYGANFILASSVKENGGGRSESTLSSNRLSQTQLTATVPATLTDVAGTLRLTVENPTPGGGRSQSVNVAVVHPVPTVQRVTPSVVTMSANDVNIVITGDRFVSTAEVLVNGQTVTVTQRTPTRLTATVPAALLATRGAYNVVVRNPQTNGTDGGTSAPLTLTVNTPQPLVTTIDLNGSPNQVPLDTVDVPLTVNGSRFQDSAIVRIVPPSGGMGTVIPTQSITGTKITAIIPASALTVGGVYSVVVENLAPTDAPSVPVTFAVVNPVPQMDSIVPTVVTASTNPQTITVYGQKCTPTSVVRWRGQNLVTTFVNRNTLMAVLPSALQIRGAVGAVTVFTPTDGVVLNGNPLGGGIGSAPGLAGVLTVTHGVPALTATAPASLLRDAWSVSALPSLTLNGNLIASTASVRIQSTGSMNPVDTTLTPTSVNANGLSLVVTVPRSVVVTAGTFALTITNPPAFPSAAYSNDGGTSASVNLTVQNPTPTLGSLTPLALAAASPNSLLTVNGSNLTRETQVFVNGVLAPRTILSATQFTTTLPASLFTLSGFVRVQALNPTPSVSGAPAGDSSNTLSLEVYNPVPTLTTASPVFAPIGGRAAADSVTITLVGTNFVRNSVARIATTVAGAPTTDLPTTFVATTTLTVRMLPADWKAQAYNMTVFNPLPRGGTSAAKRFTVTNPLPVLTALLPNSTTATGKVWTLRTVGNFFTATSQISYNKVLQSLVNTTYIPNALTPSTQDTLLVKLPAVPVGDTTFPVVVYNPPTGGVGGGASDTLRLAVGLPAPTITSLSPATTTATFGDKNRAWTLTVNGTLFDDAAQVLVNGVPVPTYFVSTTRLRAVLPDSMQSQQARRSVQVRNTPVLVSNLTTLTVQNPAPVLSLISPSTVTAGRDTTLVLTGDRFAPDATVRVVYGGVTSVLTPSRRDSVNSVTVPLPANIINAQGNYSVQIINKGLQPTMVPPDTTVLGGGLDALTLTVQHDALAIVEYIGVDTLVNAGANMPAFTVRFRDRVQNLMDNDGAIVYYASTTGSVASYWSLTRTSLGTYRTPVTPFPQAESYRLWVDTAAYGALAVVGANRFRVQPLADSIVTFTGLETRAYVAAGDTLPSFTAAIVDKLGNPTDNSSLRFSYARSAAVGVIASAPASGATVRAARLQTGLYRIESTVATIAGVYTYSLAGIPTHVGQRTVEVMPRTPASVDFANVREIVVAGQKQTAVQVTYRDRYGNLTDSLSNNGSAAQNRLWYSNSTDATLTAPEALTQSETLTQRVYTKTGVPLSGFPYRGIYDASNAVTFPAAGKYSLAVDGVTTTTGTTAFEVVPNVDYRVMFAGVPDTLTAGDTLRNVVVRYFDASGNPTDNGIGRVLYTRAGGSSTASVSMVRTGEGVYALNATQATLTGTYTMTVSGIATVNYQGNRAFVVKAAPAINASFTISTGAMTARGASVTMTIQYNDTFGNVAAFGGDIVAENQQLASTATVSTTRQTNGLYTARLTVLEPGLYKLTSKTASTTLPVRGVSEFSINPGLAVRALFANVPASVVVKAPIQGVSVQFFDGLGAPTNHWYGAATVSGPETKPVIFNMRDEFGIMHSGFYDLDSATVINSVGRHSFVVYDTANVELRMSGTRGLNVVALPLVGELTVGTTNSDSTVTAGTAIPVTVILRDTLGNVADAYPVRLLATTSATAPSTTNSAILRVLTRSVVNGLPQFTTTITPSTAGTYTFAFDVLPVLGRAPTLVGKNPLVVVPTVANAAEFRGVRDTVAVNVPQAPFGVVFRDRFGNITESETSVSFTKAGTPVSTGTITLTRFFGGVSTATATAFVLPGAYTLSIPGFATANMTGQRTFVVKANYTAPIVYTHAFVTVSGVPASVVAGNPVPSVTVTVRDSATLAPLALTNPYGRWFYKGVSDIPLVLLATGQTGVYSAMSTKPLVTEAATYSMELSADYAVVRFQQETPRLPVIGSALHHVKVQEFLTAPAPLYTDILPGHRQGDTLPPFLIRGYDEFNNLTAIDNGVALRRLGSETQPYMLLPVAGRMIVRGLFESNPIPLDSVGEFSLVWLNTPPPPVLAKGGATVQSGGGAVIPLVDDDGLTVGKIRVMERGKDTFAKVRPVRPILICANPYIIPTRAASTNLIDRATLNDPHFDEIASRFDPQGYHLVWSDEFNGTGLDRTKWNIKDEGFEPAPYRGDNNFDYGNAFVPGNVSVSGGSLHLAIRKESGQVGTVDPNSNKTKHIKYSSGGIHGQRKADFRYGKIVVKVKNVPNVNFIHHGVWAYSSEAGAPGLEVDFPDAPNSPIPSNGNNKKYADGTDVEGFNYTYLNNSHPRMAMAVIGSTNKGGDIAFADVSCAAKPDSNNTFHLEVSNQEREYWMEWDRDARGGYIKVGTIANGVTDTATWWGLKNDLDPKYDNQEKKEYGGAQFIPDADRPVDVVDEAGKRRPNNNQTIDRFNAARQTRKPFDRFSTWYYDYFPMFLHLDVEAFSGWAGGSCAPGSGWIDPRTKRGNLFKDQCDSWLRAMENDLAGVGQSMDIDYVRVYQRTRSAQDLRPLILNGENFTEYSVARLYKSTDVNGEYRELETRPWNSNEIVVMIRPGDEEFAERVGATRQGFIRVFNDAGPNADLSSSPKRIIFGIDDQAIVRSNHFSHRYQRDLINTDALPGEPSLIIQEDNKLPNHPFNWASTIDQLSLDLYTLPHLGGPAGTTTGDPVAGATLRRSEVARGKWDLRFRNAATQQFGTMQSLPQNDVPVFPDPLWKPENSSQYRWRDGFKALKLSNSISNAMVGDHSSEGDNIVSALGYYPSCADLIEVTAKIVSPPEVAPGSAPTDLYNNANLCGPFTVRWYIDPKPFVKVVESTVTAVPNSSNISATMSLSVETSPMMGNIAGATYQWEREIWRKANPADKDSPYQTPTGNLTWQPITLNGANTPLNGTYAATLELQDSVRFRCTANLSGVAATNTVLDRTCLTMTSTPTQIRMPNQKPSTFLTAKTVESNLTASSKPPLSSENETLIKSHQSAHLVNLLTAPNPADAQLGLRFTLPEDAITSIEVLDALQRTVLTPQEPVLLSKGANELALVIGSLPSGSYSLRVKAILTNGKLIVEHRSLIIAR